jgi:hypothetical protein
MNTILSFFECECTEFTVINAVKELTKINETLLTKKINITESLAKAVESQLEIKQENLVYTSKLLELVRNLSVVSENQNLFSQTMVIEYASQMIVDYCSKEDEIYCCICRLALQMISNILTDNQLVQLKKWPFIASCEFPSLVLKGRDYKSVRSCLIMIYNCTHNNRNQALSFLDSMNGVKSLLSVIQICQEFVNQEGDINFELGITIVTAFLETDSLPSIWINLRYSFELI